MSEREWDDWVFQIRNYLKRHGGADDAGHRWVLEYAGRSVVRDLTAVLISPEGERLLLRNGSGSARVWLRVASSDEHDEIAIRKQLATNMTAEEAGKKLLDIWSAIKLRGLQSSAKLRVPTSDHFEPHFEPNTSGNTSDMEEFERVEALKEENLRLRAEREEARSAARGYFAELPHYMGEYAFQKHYGEETERYPWLSSETKE